MYDSITEANETVSSYEVALANYREKYAAYLNDEESMGVLQMYENAAASFPHATAQDLAKIRVEVKRALSI